MYGATTFKEMLLNTGLNLGFLFRGYKKWIDPVMNRLGLNDH